jgi:hypothetical protein
MPNNHDIPDSDWILRGADGSAAALIKKAMKVQPEILGDFSEEEKKQGDGFACQLIIDGEDGGIFLLQFNSETGLSPKPLGVPIRNTVWSDEDTLISLGSLDVSDIVVIKQDPDDKEEVELTGLEAFVWLIDNGKQDLLPELHTITTIMEASAEGKIKFGGKVPQNVDLVKWQGIYNEAINKRLIPMIKEQMVLWAKRAKENRENDVGN